MAGQRSTVAAHPERAQIDARLRKGDAASRIASDYGLSRQAMDRYKSKLMARPAVTGDGERDEMRRKIQSLYNSVVALMKVAQEE